MFSTKVSPSNRVVGLFPSTPSHDRVLSLADHNMKKLVILYGWNVFILIDYLLLIIDDVAYVHRNSDCIWFNKEYTYLLTYLNSFKTPSYLYRYTDKCATMR